MRKAVISTLFAAAVFISAAFAANAAQMEILAPWEAEIEIAPKRDFYVVGKIGYGYGEEKEPLNIIAEMTDRQGNVVRSVESALSNDTLTPTHRLMTEYESGFAENSAKGVNILSFPPPDIVYDGFERESFRNASGKMVVRDLYFAAVIYGGATKDFDLKYVTKDDNPLSDIEEGSYTLTVRAVNSEGEEICSARREIIVGTECARVIYNSSYADGSSVASFAEENGATVSNSVAGLWKPYCFTSAPKNFTYLIGSRFYPNLKAEYSAAKEAKLLLYAADLNSKEFASSLGNASKADMSFFFYDMGEAKVRFDFLGRETEKQGTLVESEEDSFIGLLRVETDYGGEKYADFDAENGVILTSGCESVFSGVYSPIGLSASPVGEEGYSIKDSVSFIRVQIVNAQGDVIYEDKCDPCIERTYPDGTKFTSRYEFEFSYIPAEEDADEHLTLCIELCAGGGEELCVREIPCSIKRAGDFFSEYDPSYWGKIYCDEINKFGLSPTGEQIIPDEAISRGNFAAMINRLFGFSALSGEGFSDLDEEDDYYTDLLTAKASGCMTGDEHERIHAHDPITREEAMIILSRICGGEGDFDLGCFEDCEEISFWAEDYVKTMCSYGIISGFEGYLHPKENITGAEAAALICKTILYLNGEDISVRKKDDGNFDEAELSEVEIRDYAYSSDTVDREELDSFFMNNLIVLDTLRSYIVSACKDGLYVRKVGSGLDVRDYRRGAYINLSSDAVRILTELSGKYSSFTVRYNPDSEDTLCFSFAKNEEGKEFGIAYTETGVSKTREFENIFGNWYYYTQK